jgi:cobalt-zinc-cadmium efflux system membrane fusion protein
MKYTAFIFSMAVAVALTACNGGKTAEKESESEEHHSEEIELTAEQMKTVGIELGTVEMKNLGSVVRANGQLMLLPQNKADVNSLSSGIIREILVTEGTPVSKGQTVATLENLDIVKIQESYLTAKQDLVFSEQEYERQKSLNVQNAGTGKVFQQAQAKYEADRARLKSLEAQLRQLNINVSSVSQGNIVAQIPITAPIAGVVGEIFVKTGSYADMQTTLMEIADNSQLQCELQVFERDFAKIKQGQTVEIGLTNSNATLTGTVYRINQSFEDDSKSIGVQVKINRPKSVQLLPKMYVSALINTGNQMLTVVPENAIANAEGKKFIFVVADEEEDACCFKKVEVITGAAELGFVEIKPLETLPEDARIITKGAFYVMSMASGEEEDE